MKPFKRITQYEIPESDLRELYLSQRLSQSEIAKLYGCSRDTIKARLQHFGIPTRGRSESLRAHYAIQVSDSELKDLYLGEGLSALKISTKLNCSPSTIYDRLRCFGIHIRSHSEAVLLHHGIAIAENNLRELYAEHGLSAAEIAEQIGCSPTTILQRLHELGIPARSLSDARRAHLSARADLHDFSGDWLEQAYLLGFRIGDLATWKSATESGVVIVESSTTKVEQVELIQHLFEAYGPVHVGQFALHEGLAYHVRCSLNNSFEFMINKPDSIPAWISNADELFLSFFAGLVDAEGSFYLNNSASNTPHGVFSIAMGSRTIIEQCQQQLAALSINCGAAKVARRAGYISKPWNITLRKDLWRFHIAAKESLLRLISLISPHLKHAHRRATMEAVRANIEWRQSYEFAEAVRWRRRKY